jgi:hypothetical protein
MQISENISKPTLSIIYTLSLKVIKNKFICLNTLLFCFIYVSFNLNLYYGTNVKTHIITILKYN